MIAALCIGQLIRLSVFSPGSFVADVQTQKVTKPYKSTKLDNDCALGASLLSYLVDEPYTQ